ncbi:unnamed protein product [Parajaminaea phylloscopi]
MAWWKPWGEGPSTAATESAAQQPGDLQRHPQQPRTASLHTQRSDAPSQLSNSNSGLHGDIGAAKTSLQHPEIFSHEPAPLTAPFTAKSFLSSLSPTIPLTSLAIGFFSGIYSGSHKAGLVFMAENAHRRPDTVQGWYFYNKTKNYKVLLSGLGRGVSTGVRLASWTGVFVLLDAACLEARRRLIGQSSAATEGNGLGARMSTSTGLQLPSSAERALGHWSDGLLAGQGTALLASTAYRISPARFLLLGSVAGSLTGALQDARDAIRMRTSNDNA